MNARWFGCALCCLVTACGPAYRAIPAGAPFDSASARLPANPQLVWKEQAGAGILGPLTVRGPAVWATTTNRLLVALAEQDGRRFWRHRFDGAVTTGATLLNENLYIATADNRGIAVALSGARGKKLWSRRIGPTRQPPLAIGTTVVFATDQGVVLGLNAGDGAIRWRAELGSTVVLPPMFVNGELITATGVDTIYALDPATGAVRRRTPLEASPSAPALPHGGRLYVPMHNGRVAVVDPATLRVERSGDVGAPVLASPRAVGDGVFVLTRDGEVWSVGGTSQQRIATLGSGARASFAAVGGALVAGLLDGRVIALDATGRTIWTYQAPRSVHAPVVGFGGGLFVALMNGEVLKLQ